jgi:hypothetical protein
MSVGRGWWVYWLVALKYLVKQISGVGVVILRIVIVDLRAEISCGCVMVEKEGVEWMQSWSCRSDYMV